MKFMVDSSLDMINFVIIHLLRKCIIKKFKVLLTQQLVMSEMVIYSNWIITKEIFYKSNTQPQS